MIKKVKVMVADIDGTLCLKGEDLMPLTRKTIRYLHAHGVLFGPASGRPMDRRILEMADFWQLGFPFDFAIGMNGGELYDRKTGKTDRYFLLSKENIRRILTFLKPFDVNAIVYSKGYDEVKALQMNDFMIESQARNHSHVIIGGIDELAGEDTGKLEVQLREKDRDEVLKAIEANACGDWQMVQTFRALDHCTFEFQDPRVNKGYALARYAENHHIPLSEVLAFGDQENDIGLVREAGWGVVLRNGDEATKSAGEAVTEYSVTQDGVGRYLKDHIIGRVKLPE